MLNFLVSSALIATVKSSSREAKVTEKILSDMGLVKQPDYKHVSFFYEIWILLKINKLLYMKDWKNQGSC